MSWVVMDPGDVDSDHVRLPGSMAQAIVMMAAEHLSRDHELALVREADILVCSGCALVAHRIEVLRTADSPS